MPFDTHVRDGVEFHAMNCPLCDSADWSSVEKNKDGANLRVQCDNCGLTYRAQFHSESVTYRVADAYSHGHIMQEVKIPEDTGVFRVWVSTDKVLV